MTINQTLPVAVVAAIVNKFNNLEELHFHGKNDITIRIEQSWYNNLTTQWEVRAAHISGESVYIIATPNKDFDFGYQLAFSVIGDGEQVRPIDYYTPEIQARIDAELNKAIEAAKPKFDSRKMRYGNLDGIDFQPTSSFIVYYDGVHVADTVVAPDLDRNYKYLIAKSHVLAYLEGLK